MALKIDIAVREGNDKGMTFHLESESQIFIGMKINDIVKGNDLKPELADYEFIITGASDKAGFPVLEDVEGSGIKRKLLKYGKGMKQKYPHGLRLRKRVHGNTLSGDIVQINLAVKKQGTKHLSEILGKSEASNEGEKQEEKPKEEKKA